MVNGNMIGTERTVALKIAHLALDTVTSDGAQRECIRDAGREYTLTQAKCHPD